jgi:hypothetical protein
MPGPPQVKLIRMKIAEASLKDPWRTLNNANAKKTGNNAKEDSALQSPSESR